jgi:hypothetical protein
LGDIWGHRIVALHLAQFDPTDIKGIPVKDDNGMVRWCPSSYLPANKTESLTGTTQKVDFMFYHAKFIMVHVLTLDGTFVGRYNDKITGELKPAWLDVKTEFDPVSGEGTVTVTAKNGKTLDGLSVDIIDKAIVFLDELSTAPPEVQNAALQLVLDRRVAEYDIPRHIPIVAAGNREKDSAYIHTMSGPLANRFIHLTLEPSLDDWIEWAQTHKIHPLIIAFVKWKGKPALFKFDQKTLANGDYGFPTPRSWHMLSDQLRAMEARGTSTRVHDAIIAGTVGRTAGSNFAAYKRDFDKLPSTDDILQGKEIEMHEQLSIGAKYGLAISLCYKLDDYHEKYWDRSTKDLKKQPKEWKIAAKGFCDFIDEYLGNEMALLCVHIVSKHLDISFTKFKDNPNFMAFAEKNRDPLRKTI